MSTPEDGNPESPDISRNNINNPPPLSLPEENYTEGLTVPIETINPNDDPSKRPLKGFRTSKITPADFLTGTTTTGENVLPQVNENDTNPVEMDQSPEFGGTTILPTHNPNQKIPARSMNAVHQELIDTASSNAGDTTWRRTIFNALRRFRTVPNKPDHEKTLPLSEPPVNPDEDTQ